MLLEALSSAILGLALAWLMYLLPAHPIGAERAGGVGRAVDGSDADARATHRHPSGVVDDVEIHDTVDGTAGDSTTRDHHRRRVIASLRVRR